MIFFCLHRNDRLGTNYYAKIEFFAKNNWQVDKRGVVIVTADKLEIIPVYVSWVGILKCIKLCESK